MIHDLKTIIGSRSSLAVGIGSLSLLLCLLGWFVNPRQFFLSYLFAELVWLGVALGSMAFHHGEFARSKPLFAAEYQSTRRCFLVLGQV